LIIGDTRTGKTRTAEMLQKHYGLGVTAQAESMSYPGLVGGCQQLFNKAWDVTWGKLPQNNRRLVIIDEATGIDELMIGKLSSIRSSGVATIEKISSQKTEAKTRILWLSNPRDGMTVNEFSSGVDVIKTLTSQPEDIARWDMALIVSKDDVSMKRMDRRKQGAVAHEFTSKRCHDLILWAWTREPNEISISTETESALYDYADLMSQKYSSDFTLVVGAEQRVKLARLATSLAARLFSTSDGRTLVVRPVHVEYIFDFLNRVYDSQYFGYDLWSDNKKLGQKITNLPAICKIMEQLTPSGCIKFLELSQFTLRNLEEYMGVPTDEAKARLATLLQNNALKNFRGNSYTKSPQFNKMLREYSKTTVEVKEEF
jgi:hypothetical protein